MVRSNAFFPIDGETVQQLVGSIAFQSGDEEYSLLGKRVKPFVVVVAAIKYNDGARLEIGLKRDSGLVDLGFSDVDECGNVTIMIQHRVHFDAGLRLAELRPREELEAKLYR